MGRADKIIAHDKFLRRLGIFPTVIFFENPGLNADIYAIINAD